MPLFQVQLDHPAQRAVTFQMRDSMNEFLRTLHKEDEAMPGTVQELERQLGVRIVIADRTDPEEVGYVQWRTPVGRSSFSRACVTCGRRRKPFHRQQDSLLYRRGPEKLSVSLGRLV